MKIKTIYWHAIVVFNNFSADAILLFEEKTGSKYEKPLHFTYLFALFTVCGLIIWIYNFYDGVKHLGTEPAFDILASDITISPVANDNENLDIFAHDHSGKIIYADAFVVQFDGHLPKATVDTSCLTPGKDADATLPNNISGKVIQLPVPSSAVFNTHEYRDWPDFVCEDSIKITLLGGRSLPGYTPANVYFGNFKLAALKGFFNVSYYARSGISASEHSVIYLDEVESTLDLKFKYVETGLAKHNDYLEINEGNIPYYTEYTKCGHPKWEGVPDIPGYSCDIQRK
jgi:hypothetical protein